MVEFAKDQGFITACTPFDEESGGFDRGFGDRAFKIASCSANDYPLLRRLKASKLPVATSTGGLTLNEIDVLVDYFEHRESDCIASLCFHLSYPSRSI